MFRHPVNLVPSFFFQWVLMGLDTKVINVLMQTGDRFLTDGNAHIALSFYREAVYLFPGAAICNIREAQSLLPLVSVNLNVLINYRFISFGFSCHNIPFYNDVKFGIKMLHEISCHAINSHEKYLIGHSYKNNEFDWSFQSNQIPCYINSAFDVIMRKVYWRNRLSHMHLLD